MRPTKESTPMVNWSKEQLLNLLNDDNTSKDLKKKVVKIFKDRQENGWIFLNRFFNKRRFMKQIICFETDPEYDFCDDCGKPVKKLYHMKSKSLPSDWYVCKKCFKNKE